MFTGPFQSQIDALVARVFALENPQAIDQNDYQNHSNIARTATGYKRLSPVDNSLISTLQQSQTQAQTQGILKKVDPAYSVVFSHVAKANSTVYADNFCFEAGFVVFMKNGSSVAAYPSNEISHITKL